MPVSIYRQHLLPINGLKIEKRERFIGMPFPVWALCTQFEKSQTYTLTAMTLINLVMPWPSLLTLTLARSLASLCFFPITFQNEKKGCRAGDSTPTGNNSGVHQPG